MNCLVTVIIPQIPSGVPFKRALNTLRRQTYKNIEVISLMPLNEETAKEYEEVSICENLNQAIHMAKGKYVYFLHQESILTTSALQRLVDKMQGSEAEICQCQIMVDSSRTIIPYENSVFATLFSLQVLKENIDFEKLFDMKLELLMEETPSNISKLNIEHTLVYFDYADTITSTIEKMKMCIVVARENVLAGDVNGNTILFNEYVYGCFDLFAKMCDEEKTENLIELFDSLQVFIKVIEPQEELLNLIRISIYPIRIDFFMISCNIIETIPSNKWQLRELIVDETIIKRIEQVEAFIWEEEKSVFVHEKNIAIEEFKNGTAGLRTLSKCFGAWISVKLRRKNK